MVEMTSLLKLLNAALILISAIEAIPTSNHEPRNNTSNSGRCIGCIVKGVQKLIGLKDGQNHRKHRCPQNQDIYPAIQDIQTNIINIKENIVNVVNIRNILEDINQEVNIQKSETINQIKSYINKFEQTISNKIENVGIVVQKIYDGGSSGGGCSGGGDVSQLTTTVVEMANTLKLFIKLTQKSDSSMVNTINQLMEYEIRNTETLNSILTVVNTLGNSGGGDCQSGTISQIQISNQEILNQMATVIETVQQNTKEIKVVVQGGGPGGSVGSALQQQITVLIEALREDILLARNKCLKKFGQLVEYFELQRRQIEVMSSTITTTRQTVAASAAAAAVSAVKKSSRELCKQFEMQ